jgi:hypothetical protein
VQPILANYCSGCHGNGGCSTGWCWLDDHDIVTEAANNVAACGGDARGECVPVRIEGGQMPPGGCLPDDPGCITSSELAVVQAWADAGMPE